MPLLNVTDDEARVLAQLRAEYVQGGSHLPFGGAAAGDRLPASLVEVVQILKPPVAGNATDDAGRCAAQLASRLVPGTATDDDPLKAPAYREPITSFTAPSTVVVSNSVKDLIAVGLQVGLIGTSADDWYTVTAVAASGPDLNVTLDRTLPSGTGSGSARLVLPRPWGRTRSTSLLSLSLHARSDIVPAIEIGTETFPLGLILWRGVLTADLGRATVSGHNARIVPAASALHVLEPNADGELVPSGLVIPIRNYDESLSLAANSYVTAIQRGAWAEILWGSCVPSEIQVP